MTERLVRVNVKINADHPLMKVPPRQRGAVARYWLDFGARLAAIEERLAKMESRHQPNSTPVKPETKPGKSGTEIDVSTFLNAFEV